MRVTEALPTFLPPPSPAARRLSIFRKPISRLRRDLTLFLRANPRLLPLLLTVSALLLLAILSLPTQIASRRLRACICTPPTTAQIFVKTALLRRNRFPFVARVLASRTSHQHFVVHTLFQAPFAVASLQLHVHPGKLFQCFSPQNSRDHSFLLLAASARPDPQHNNTALLEPIDPPCSRLQRLSTTHQRVFLYPWHSLSSDVIDNLQSNLDQSDSWWRNLAARKSAAALLHNLTHPTQPSQFPSPDQLWIRPGVSIVAACKDRSEPLNTTLPTWLRSPFVTQVILVDWTSSPAIRHVLPSNLLHNPRLRLISVLDQPHWLLSTAYNLAVQAATTTHILKLDCDTVLHPDFFQAHNLTDQTFFAGDWHQLQRGASEKLHANGLLFVARRDFLVVGGYDERITTYGWDDSDIVSRLSSFRTPLPILYDKIAHLSHNASLRVAHSHALLSSTNPHAAAVEIQRNRLLMTRFHLPPWHPTALHVLWNIYCVPPSPSPAANSLPRPCDVFARAASTVTPALQLVSDADALEVSKRAIRLILRRLGVDLLPKTLSLPFYKSLIEKVAFAPRYAHVVVSLRGGCVSRLLAHVQITHVTNSELSLISDYVSPPQPYKDWRIQELWHFPSPQCSCKFSSAITAVEEEVSSVWSDMINPLPVSFNPNITRNATKVLDSFDRLAVAKNVSEDVSRWETLSHNQSDSRPRILFADLACHADPSQLTAPQIAAIRAGLRRITPSEVILEMLDATQPTRKRCALDSQFLSLEFMQQLLLPLSNSLEEPNWDAFTSPPLIEMARKWSPAFIVQREPRSAKRALSLYGAIYLYHQLRQNISEDTVNNTAVPNDARNMFSELSTTVEPLFTGCATSAFPYLHAYPEVAVIVSSFVCTGLCV